MKHWLLLWRNCLVLSSDPFCIRNLVFTGNKKKTKVKHEEFCKHYSPSNHTERQLWDPLVFLLLRKWDSCPRGKGWKKGRWYTDEEERVLGIWSNPSTHVPVHTAACSSVHSAPPYTSRETVKTACCPLPPRTAPNTSLSLAAGYRQV